MSLSHLGRIIGLIVSRIGGQLLLELPDDLPPEFVSGLVRGANEALPRDPHICLFAHDKRTDLRGLAPSVDFRELAMYRQGNHLAVAYASDNRSMATYTSVYPTLFSSGFPSSNTNASANGVVSRDAFFDEISAILGEKTNGALQQGELRESFVEAANFLTDIYQLSGNGQTSLAADWWQHIAIWIESLLSALPQSRSEGLTRTVYGSAGLPVPDRGSRLGMRPQDYLQVLQDRWSNAVAARQELARLEFIPTAATATAQLAKIDWESEVSQFLLRTDSPIARVALAGYRTNSAERTAGWSSLTESDFRTSFVDAQGKLSIRQNEVELPRPWVGALPVIVLEPEHCNSEVEITVDDLGILIPWKDGMPADGENTDATVLVSGLRGSEIKFVCHSKSVTHEGLLMNGQLIATPSKKSPTTLSLQALVTGAHTAALPDQATCTIAIARPDDVVIQIRRSGKRASGKKIPLVRVQNNEPRDVMTIGAKGKYEFSFALGRLLRGRPVELPPLTVREGWPGFSSDGLSIYSGEIDGTIEVLLGGSAILRITTSDTGPSPVSPITAAAYGLLPDHDAVIERVPLGALEDTLLACLSTAAAGKGLGHFIISSSRERRELVEPLPGIFVDQITSGRLTEISPSGPSNQLLASAEYEALIDAYTDLGLPDYISQIEEHGNTTGITPSRISLLHIPETKIHNLLECYTRLIDVNNDSKIEDFFWSRHPFSIVVYPDEPGAQTVQAILMSPLHPIRLAWLWSIQAGLTANSERDGDPTSALSMLDGSQFPATTVFVNEFGSNVSMLPVPVDASPNDVYSGWQMAVRITNDQKLSAPDWMNGDRFPVDGLSGLSKSAVSSAIDDFMRVSPHVQSLRISLDAIGSMRRSRSIDDGIIEKLADLSRSSNSFDGVGGVKIFDSPNRQGPIPTFRRIAEDLGLSRASFNAQWSARPPANFITPEPSHVTFLEGLAALLGIVPSPLEPAGWLPKIPLRRFPIRRRVTNDQAAISYALGEPSSPNRFWSALRAYEQGPNGAKYEVRIRPNLAALPQRPNWLVTSDFGIDPQSIAAASSTLADGSYMLWDWRPATAARGPRHNSNVRSQPYFVMAAIPPALSNSIDSRIRKLKPSADGSEVEKRVKHLVHTLSTRAVGLNTLLSIGHHQATGALGFFFALSSLSLWMNDSSPGEMRVVVPIDAVDPFLRSIVTKQSDRARRADLLAIRAEMIDGRASVTLVPVEIKHYGLNNVETASTFPDLHEARFVEHIDQLRHYQGQMAALCSDYANATLDQSSILGQQIAVVLEAAIQLSPSGNSALASAILEDISRGSSDVQVGKGLLLWFQAGASTSSGSKARWEEVYGPVESRRVDVWIDPTAYDDEYWGEVGKFKDSSDSAHGSVVKALSVAATRDIGTGIAASSTQGQGGPLGDASETNTSVATDNPAVTPSANGSIANSQVPDRVTPPADAAAIGVAPRRMSKERLESTYRTIMAALAEFNVSVQRPANIEAYQEGPAFIEFSVRPTYGVSFNKIESQLENVKLRLQLPMNASITCTNHLGNVVLTIPKDESDRYFVETSEIWAKWQRPNSGFQIPLGEDISGNIVTIDFSSSNSPHLLIAGTTGSGKSEALLTLLHGAAHYYSRDELELRLIDPKQTELVSLSSLPHCSGDIGWSAEEAIEILASAADEMDSRYIQFRQNRVRDIEEYRAQKGNMARTLIVLDEYADLTTDDEDRKQIEKQLKRLAQKARAAGIHVILSTQKPVVQVINTVIKGNLPARIALRVSNGTESRVVMDELGAEALAGKGDAFLKIANERTRLQFARFDG